MHNRRPPFAPTEATPRSRFLERGVLSRTQDTRVVVAHLRWSGIAMPTATKQRLKIHPLADRVAIRLIEATADRPGGRYIPETAKAKPTQGAGIAAGPG